MKREDKIREFVTKQIKCEDEGLMNIIRESAVFGLTWADNNPKNPWRKVEDELPITNAGYKYIVLIKRYCDYCETPLFQSVNEVIIDHLKRDGNKNFTHWMPIPSVEGE